MASSSTISNCSNTGAVTGKVEYTGGIVGLMAQADNVSNSKVENCYNLGNVKGEIDVGGIVGLVGGNLGEGTVINCYSKGKVSGTKWIGAVIGRQTNSTGLNTLKNLYYLNEVGIGAINGEDDEVNKIEAIEENFNSLEEFLNWIKTQ